MENRMTSEQSTETGPETHTIPFARRQGIIPVSLLS
jgi:hypothetical protein